ncbi:MAG: alpha/beta fold hydrolase [Sphingomonadales bacterium]|nr:alpha/beta fold hydrolase [Sphingomonadales bacterium]
MSSTEYFQSGGLRLAYERAGSGPFLIFLHGIGGNRLNWQDQVNEFSGRFTTIAWDARGYGDSDDPKTPLEFSQFAEDLRNLLDHLGAKKAHLVGLSMGGMIVQDFYGRHPERVLTLTLVNTSSGFHVLSKAEQSEFLDKRLKPLEAGLTLKQIAPPMADVLLAAKATAEARHKILQSLEALRAEPYKMTLRAILTTDFRSVLPKIKVPTLIIVGDEDRVLPPRESESLARLIPHSDLVVLKGVGHLSNIEAPEVFNAKLEEFLSRYAP